MWVQLWKPVPVALAGHSFCLPFSQSGQLGGTSPAESGGGVAPPPPSMSICLKTSQHPWDVPFPRWKNPQYPPAPSQQWFYPFYPHSAILVDYGN